MPVSAGFVIGWPLTVAAIPTNWVLCDGNNGTPDLGTYPYLMGRNATNGGVAEDCAKVSVSVDSTGSHSGSTNYVRSSKTSTGTYTAAASTAGAHPHTADGFASFDPAHQKIAFIMSTTDTVVPKDAVLWVQNASAPGSFVSYAALADKFAKAQTGDTRTSGGIDALVYSITGFSWGGAHTHSAVGNNYNPGGSYTNYRTRLSSGGHDHPDLTDQEETATKPPFIALLAVQANEDTGAVDKLVCFYTGDLVDLPAGWGNCDGTGGRIDGQDKAILGSGTESVGATGGDDSNVSGSIGTGNKTVSHTHARDVGYNISAVTPSKRHGTYALVHAHTVTFEFKKQCARYYLWMVQYLAA